MIHYNVWFSFKEGIAELDALARVRQFLLAFTRGRATTRRSSGEFQQHRDVRTELLWLESAWPDSNGRECFEHSAIEGRERDLLADRQLYEQSVVHRYVGLVRAHEGTFPERSVRHGMDAEPIGEGQALRRFIEGQHLVTNRHPDRIGQFRLPQRGSPGLVEHSHEVTGLIDKAVRPKHQVSDH